jgi:hypothetical protein
MGACLLDNTPGVYIYIGKYPPAGGKKYQPMSFGGKYEKAKRKSGKNVKEKGRKGKK